MKTKIIALLLALSASTAYCQFPLYSVSTDTNGVVQNPLAGKFNFWAKAATNDAAFSNAVKKVGVGFGATNIDGQTFYDVTLIGNSSVTSAGKATTVTGYGNPQSWNNNNSPVPPLGACTWFQFGNGNGHTEDEFYKYSDYWAGKQPGLFPVDPKVKSHGNNQFFIDFNDCMLYTNRLDANNLVAFNTNLFPSGVQALVNKVHTNGQLAMMTFEVTTNANDYLTIMNAGIGTRWVCTSTNWLENATNFAHWGLDGIGFEFATAGIYTPDFVISNCMTFAAAFQAASTNQNLFFKLHNVPALVASHTNNLLSKLPYGWIIEGWAGPEGDLPTIGQTINGMAPYEVLGYQSPGRWAGQNYVQNWTDISSNFLQRALPNQAASMSLAAMYSQPLILQLVGQGGSETNSVLYQINNDRLAAFPHIIPQSNTNFAVLVKQMSDGSAVFGLWPTTTATDTNTWWSYTITNIYQYVSQVGGDGAILQDVNWPCAPSMPQQYTTITSNSIILTGGPVAYGGTYPQYLPMVLWVHPMNQTYAAQFAPIEAISQFQYTFTKSPVFQGSDEGHPAASLYGSASEVDLRYGINTNQQIWETRVFGDSWILQAVNSGVGKYPYQNVTAYTNGLTEFKDMSTTNIAAGNVIWATNGFVAIPRATAPSFSAIGSITNAIFMWCSNAPTSTAPTNWFQYYDAHTNLTTSYHLP